MVPFAGVRLGHATHPQFPTGCTVFLCPPGTYGSVDSRGPAPGSRELALLRAVGATRGQVRGSVLLEAMVLGLLASTLGLGFGIAVGQQINPEATNLTGWFDRVKSRPSAAA